MVAHVNRPHYDVRAELHGRWWLLTVPAVPGAVSQVRNLRQAEDYAREAVAFVADVEPDSFELTIAPELPESLRADVARVRAGTHQLLELQTRVAELSRRTAAELLDAGLTGADTAAVLGVSPQRVSQLVRS